MTMASTERTVNTGLTAQAPQEWLKKIMNGATLTRVSNEPVLEPTPDDPTERYTCNPAIMRDKAGLRMLYRADGFNGVSTLKWARSSDGVNWTKQGQAVENPQSNMSLEDPRITHMADSENILVLCTHADKSVPVASIGIYNLKNNEFDFIATVNKEHGKENDSDKDGALFPEQINGKYVITRRPFPNVKLASADSLAGPWTLHQETVIEPRSGAWDNLWVGGGSPPIKTPLGWFMIYHGVGDGKIYRLGAVLLDLKDPSKVVWRSPEDKPLLEPELGWEREGWVPNVTFSCNAVEFNGTLWTWYAGADSKIGAAKINVD